jgi:hypothetical protein
LTQTFPKCIINKTFCFDSKRKVKQGGPKSLKESIRNQAASSSGSVLLSIPANSSRDVLPVLCVRARTSYYVSFVRPSHTNTTAHRLTEKKEKAKTKKSPMQAPPQDAKHSCSARCFFYLHSVIRRSPCLLPIIFYRPSLSNILIHRHQ